MVVMDFLKVFHGEIRVINRFYDDAEIGIINTKYQGWVKVSYMNCEIEDIQLEMLNTAVLSARPVIFINSEGAGLDPGDVEEATSSDIQEVIDNIYADDPDDGNDMTEDEEVVRTVTETYYDHTPLPGDENDFGDHDAEEATDQEVQEIVDGVYPNQQPQVQPESESNDEDDVEEATQEDIDNLLNGLYN